MPLEMTRPPKIPVGKKAPSEIERLEVEVMDDGSYVVTCFHRQSDDEGGGVSFASPKKYTFKSMPEMTAFISDKLSNASTKAKGTAAGSLTKAMGRGAARREAIMGESKRAPTRGAGEAGAPAYAETQTDTGDEYSDEEEA
jgi:hypothetical protein